MINLFDVQNKVPIPATCCYLIPEIKRVIEKFPKEYMKALAYIFFTTCPDSMNPYLNIDENLRKEVVIADQQPFTFSLEDPDIAMARDKCRMLYQTPTLRILIGAKMMLDEMGLKLQSPLTFGKNGNATDMRGIMKEIKGYTKDYMEIEGMVREEQSKVRGGLKRRYDQIDSYKNLKGDIEGKESI